MKSIQLYFGKKKKKKKSLQTNLDDFLYTEASPTDCGASPTNVLGYDRSLFRLSHRKGNNQFTSTVNRLSSNVMQ